MLTAGMILLAFGVLLAAFKGYVVWDIAHDVYNGGGAPTMDFVIFIPVPIALGGSMVLSALGMHPFPGFGLVAYLGLALFFGFLMRVFDRMGAPERERQLQEIKKAHQKSNHTPILAFALLITLLAGCGKENTTPGGAAVTAGSAPAVKLFEGTIRAKQWVHSPINAFEITYTIGRDEIRREAVSKSVVDKVLEKLTGPTIAGVICRPAKDEVVLYCEALGKKRFCKLTLAAYQDLCAFEGLSSAKGCLGFGHLFLDLPEESRWKVQNVKDHVTVAGFLCDHHMLSWEDSVQSTTITTDHTAQIQVPRERLLLVEPGMPASITGFPLVIRRVESLTLLQAVKAKPEDDRAKRWLAKAAKLASDGLKKMLESGMEILQVDTTAPADSAFELPSGYTEIATPEMFKAEFSGLESSGGDWDD